MIILLGVITFFYTGLILFLLFGFTKIKEPKHSGAGPSLRFSVVIPFRNEAENFPDLFASLSRLNYPTELFEILLVNDASEDASEEMCREFKVSNPELNIRILNSVRKSTSPKKDAVSTAVAEAENEYIVTTDADCILPKDWLRELDSFIASTGNKMIAGPVQMLAGEKNKLDFLKIFQEIDFLSLQGATIGGFGADLPFMCNGANLCYEKESFKKVKGFEGNDNIGSGDDIFVLEKFVKQGLAVGFIKNYKSVVSTSPQTSLPALVSQRIRWAAKTSAYNNAFGKAVGVAVLIMNLFLLLGMVMVLTGTFPEKTFFFYFLVKFNVDFLLIYKSSIFFRREKLMKNYFWCSFVYPFFSSYVAISSLFSGYSWKGRSFQK